MTDAKFNGVMSLMLENVQEDYHWQVIKSLKLGAFHLNRSIGLGSHCSAWTRRGFK